MRGWVTIRLSELHNCRSVLPDETPEAPHEKWQCPREELKGQYGGYWQEPMVYSFTG